MNHKYNYISALTSVVLEFGLLPLIGFIHNNIYICQTTKYFQGFITFTKYFQTFTYTTRHTEEPWTSSWILVVGLMIQGISCYFCPTESVKFFIHWAIASMATISNMIFCGALFIMEVNLDNECSWYWRKHHLDPTTPLFLRLCPPFELSLIHNYI